jgi:hypothetical protein
MKYFGLLIGFLALSLFVLPGLTAQEKKDDDTKPEKKEPKAKKEKKPVEEKPAHGAVVQTKILSMKADSARDFTVEIPMPDQQKMYDLQVWMMQQQMSIAQSPNVQTYVQRMNSFQQQLASKNTNTLKPVEVRASEKCKVRIMYPPLQYDDAGNLKKWTKKEIAALKAKSKLPGFPADFDLLKTGQYVEIYMAKPPPTPKGSGAQPKRKKKMEDDPDLPIAVPEVVMIVIVAEPMGR